jgi:hypothetical protein
MTRHGTAGVLALLAALVGVAACRPKAPDVPGRETVTPLLRHEAEGLKAENEKLDPILRVKATWTIEGVDVNERPGDPDQPWAGTIRFRIQSMMRDEQGVVTTDEFERRFDYLFSAALGRWIFQLPPSPAP